MIKICPGCKWSILKEDVWHWKDWLKCLCCGFMEPKVKKCKDCASCDDPCGRNV